MRADVEDDPVGVDPARHVDGVAHRRDRLLVDVLLGAREVDEVQRMAEDAFDPGLLAPLLEALERGGIVVRRRDAPGSA